MTARKIILSLFITFYSMLAFTFSVLANADANDLTRLQQAYPEYISSVTNETVTWADGTTMRVHEGNLNKSRQEKLDHPALYDQLHQIHYVTGIPANPAAFNPADDPGLIRYEPFFRKMYGNSKEEVETKLVVIYWLPKYFGNRYPLLVTTVNEVDKKLSRISAELELLVAEHPEYLAYLNNPGGTFNWRVIAHTTRLSPHSFGMTIDINVTLSNYWQWDLQKSGVPVNEDAPLTYQNNLPWEIVPVFEKYGFIWGGKWRHYDSMHFEYRPELIIA